MKLVPLLLAEWMSLYPSTTETVKSFLVRIRFLKSNKEMIKLRLGQHNLLPKMSQQPNQVNIDKRKNSLVLRNGGWRSVTGCPNKHKNSVTNLYRLRFMRHFFMNTIIAVFKLKHLISKTPGPEILKMFYHFCIFKTNLQCWL